MRHVERKRQACIVAVVGALLGALTLLGSVEIAAARHHGSTVLVGDPTPGDDGTPPFTCGTAANPCDTIQHGIDHARPGDQVVVAAGTYVEQVVINKRLTLTGAGAASTIIQGPGGLATETDGDGVAIVEITGAGTIVTMSGFKVRGALGDVTSAVHVHGSANARLVHNVVEGTDALSGAAAGHGITVGSSLNGADDVRGTVTISENTLTGFHRAGIVVIGPGNRATIEDNTITGAGPTSATDQQGITIQEGATARIRGNSVSNLAYTGGPIPTAVGIFLFDAKDGIEIEGNTVVDAQTGILVQAEKVKISENHITATDALDTLSPKGIWILGRGSASTSCVGGNGVTPGLGCSARANLTENTLTGAGAGTGLVVGETAGLPFTPAPASATLRRNDITGWATAIEVGATGSVVQH